jgi:hypothetical protein
VRPGRSLCTPLLLHRRSADEVPKWILGPVGAQPPLSQPGRRLDRWRRLTPRDPAGETFPFASFETSFFSLLRKLLQLDPPELHTVSDVSMFFFVTYVLVRGALRAHAHQYFESDLPHVHELVQARVRVCARSEQPSPASRSTARQCAAGLLASARWTDGAPRVPKCA